MKDDRPINRLICKAGERVKARRSTLRVCPPKTRLSVCLENFGQICFHLFTSGVLQRVGEGRTVHLAFIRTSPAASFSSLWSSVRILTPRSQLPDLVCFTFALGTLACRRCTKPFTAGMVLSRNPLSSAHCLNCACAWPLLYPPHAGSRSRTLTSIQASTGSAP